MSGPCSRVGDMSTPSTGQEVTAAPIPDPEWLRAKRRSIHTDADLHQFDEELGRLVEDLHAKPGSGVGKALVWTAGGVMVTVLLLLAGWGLLEMGLSMWEWLSE